MTNAENTPLRVLLVEDDEIDRECLERLFRKLDLKIELSFAHDGLAAVQMLGLQKEQVNNTSMPDLILLDINMPKMNGLEVLETLAENDIIGQTKIVMLTTSDREQDIQDAAKFGIDSYLVKPISMDMLQNLIRMA